MKGLVSVIIPTYNASETIERALKSVILQTYSDYEIIVIDDGSSDNTQEVVDEFRKEFDSILVQYIVQKNLGPSSARNNGVKKSQGEFIAFLDADDEWHKDKLKIQIEIMQDKNLDFLGSAYQYDEFDYKNIDEIKMEEYNFNDLLLKNRFSTPGVIIRKDFLLELCGFDESLKYVEDHDLWLRCALKSNLIGIENPKLVRLHKGAFGVSGLSSHMRNMFKGELLVVKKLFLSNDVSFLKYALLNLFLFVKFFRRYMLKIMNNIKSQT